MHPILYIINVILIAIMAGIAGWYLNNIRFLRILRKELEKTQAGSEHCQARLQIINDILDEI